MEIEYDRSVPEGMVLLVPKGHKAVVMDPDDAAVDIHTATAALIYGVGVDEVTKTMREEGKHYNMTPESSRAPK